MMSLENQNITVTSSVEGGRTCGIPVFDILGSDENQMTECSHFPALA